MSIEPEATERCRKENECILSNAPFCSKLKAAAEADYLLLNVSIDYHLDDGEKLDFTVIREKIADNLIVFLMCAPFGIPEFLNSMKNTDKDFYLVNEPDRQYFVVVTDEFIEVRQLSTRITDKKFKIGGFSFMDCGPIPEKTR